MPSSEDDDIENRKNRQFVRRRKRIKRNNVTASRPTSLGNVYRNVLTVKRGRKYADACIKNAVKRILLTFDNGVVAAPVKENACRRLGTAVNFVSLKVGKRQTQEIGTIVARLDKEGHEMRGDGLGSGSQQLM